MKLIETRVLGSALQKKYYGSKLVSLIGQYQRKKGRYRLGHIPFKFDSFGSLVHLPVQGYILFDRFLMEGYADGRRAIASHLFLLNIASTYRYDIYTETSHLLSHLKIK